MTQTEELKTCVQFCRDFIASQFQHSLAARSHPQEKVFDHLLKLSERLDAIEHLMRMGESK